MVRAKIGVYIPFITTVSERGPFGGYGRMKRYIAKVFARPDADGAMTLGLVTKVKIIVNKNMRHQEESGMAMGDENAEPGRHVASAFVTFVPSGTKACSRLVDEINSDDGLRLIHNQKKMLFWNIHRQRKQQESDVPGIICPLCGSTNRDASCRNSRHQGDDDMLAAFSRLSCDDEPGKKRMRRQF